MRKITVKELLLWVSLVVIVGQAGAFYFTTRDRNQDVDILKEKYRNLRIENYCTHQYVEALAKKILTEDEFRDLKMVVEADRKELERLLSNGDDK